MKTLKKILRLFALILIIALASVLPITMSFCRKDDLPKYVVEQIDSKDDKGEEANIKELF